MKLTIKKNVLYGGVENNNLSKGIDFNLLTDNQSQAILELIYSQNKTNHPSNYTFETKKI